MAKYNYPFIAWPEKVKPQMYTIVYEDMFDCKRNPFSTCNDFIYCTIDWLNGDYEYNYSFRIRRIYHLGDVEFFSECAQNNFYQKKDGKNYCRIPLEYMYSTSRPFAKYPQFLDTRIGGSSNCSHIDTSPNPIPYKNEKKNGNVYLKIN